MVKITDLTITQINSALVDIQNQINNINYRLEKAIGFIENKNKKDANK